MARATGKRGAAQRSIRKNRRPIRKDVTDGVWEDPGGQWKVVTGRLVPQVGKPPKTKQLFRYMEKLPYGSLGEVRKWMADIGAQPVGVYLAHDSMGVARYGGRGQIFSRLATHKRNYPKELTYYSFYVVEDITHEREIETVILRAAGPQLILNTRKVRDDIEPGSVRDYEPRTIFFERQYRRGKRKKAGAS